MPSTACYARRMAACTVLAAALGATAQAALLDGAVWFERPVGQGVVWRYYQFDDLFGAKQSVSYMDVDLNNANVGLDINYRVGATVQNPPVFPRAKTSVLANETATARAAINGTYFNTASYNAATPNAVWGGGTTYLKVSNSVVHTFDGTNVNNFGMGLVFNGTKSGLQIRRRPSGGWSTIQSSWNNMMACGPALLVNGVVETYAGTNDHANLRHPRSAIGVTLSNHLILFTVDGRTSDSAGMSCTELANVMKELGCDDAINMDGGGSTTLWAKGEPFDGVVNYPSDNGVYDHLGERSCANALVVTSTAPTAKAWDGRLTNLTYSNFTRSGDTFTVTATYQNVGTQTWTTSNVRAVPSRAFGRNSGFVPNGQELTFSTLAPSSVAPGATATVTLNLVPPTVSTDTLFVENFALWHSTNGYFGPADNELRVQTTVRPEFDGTPPPMIVQGGTTGPNNQWYFETSGSWSNSSVSFTAPGVDNSGTQRFVGATATGNQAAFRPIFDVAGPYTVDVAFPASSNSISVRYTVNHSGGANTFNLDQNTAGGLANAWQTLGTFQFGTGTSGGAGVHSVTVGNPATTGNRFYSGAVRFTYAGDLTPPAPPTGLAATSGSGTVSLNWNDNAEADLAGYDVYRSTTSGGPYSKINATLLPASAYTDNGVSDGTTYYYVVRALDGSTPPNASPNSAQVSATPQDTTPPAAPTGLGATAGDGTVTLNWNDNSESDLDGYNVYRSTTSGGPYSKINSTLLPTSTYADNAVSNFTTYYYVVRAVDSAPAPNTSANSAQVAATPQDTTPPAAPTGLLAFAGNASVALDWNNNAEPDLAGYNVFRGTASGGPYTKINASLLAASAYTDATAAAGTAYYYVVRAVDNTPNANTSGNSAQASATPYSATNIALQAEAYDNGGEGVGYHDTTAGNSGGQYRSNDVDIVTSSAGGFAVQMANTEWLHFSNVAGNGSSYRVTASVASASATGAFTVEVNGIDATGLVVFPATGGAQTWTTIDCGTVALSNGANTVRLVSEGDGWNVDWIKLDVAAPVAGIVDWDQFAVAGYAGQDLQPNQWRILDNGSTINLYGNTWKRITLNRTSTSRTVVELDYKSDAGEPEVGGFAFDNDDVVSNNKSWKVFGTESFGSAAFDNYSFAGNGWKHYTIPVGQTLPLGAHPYFAVVNDRDAGGTANSWFRNVRIYDTAQQTVTVNNDGGAPGFTVAGSWSTTTTGGFNNGSYRWSSVGQASTAATWTLNLPAPGWWTIAVQYRAGTNRATAAKYTVQTASGPVNVNVNQQNNNLAWVNLGTWQFNAGNTTVVLDATGSSGGTVVVADVVRAQN